MLQEFDKQQVRRSVRINSFGRITLDGQSIFRLTFKLASFLKLAGNGGSSEVFSVLIITNVPIFTAWRVFVFSGIHLQLP